MCRYSTKCRCHRTTQNAHRLNPYGKGNGPCPKCGKSKTNEATQCMACKWAELRIRKAERLRTAPPSKMVACACGGQKCDKARECSDCRLERLEKERQESVCRVCDKRVGMEPGRLRLHERCRMMMRARLSGVIPRELNVGRNHACWRGGELKQCDYPGCEEMAGYRHPNVQKKSKRAFCEIHRHQGTSSHFIPPRLDLVECFCKKCGKSTGFHTPSQIKWSDKGVHLCIDHLRRRKPNAIWKEIRPRMERASAVRRNTKIGRPKVRRINNFISARRLPVRSEVHGGAGGPLERVVDGVQE